MKEATIPKKKTTTIGKNTPYTVFWIFEFIATRNIFYISFIYPNDRDELSLD